MSYKLFFHPKALNEWGSLDTTIKEQFKKKLAKILQHPKIPKNQLRGYKDTYKIKLRQSGFRLAYRVIDDEVLIYVLAVDKRDKNKIYNLLKNRQFIDFNT